MKARVFPGRIRGSVRIPGTKSITQRYILLSAFMNRRISILNPSGSADEETAISAAKKCGSVVSREDGMITVHPNFRCPDIVDGGESGTTSRLLMGLLAGSGCRTHLRLSSQLMNRPFDDLIDFLRQNSVTVKKIDNGYIIDASKRSFDYRRIRADRSSQFVSGALYYLSLGGMENFDLMLEGSVVSSGYLDLTLSCLSHFGYSGIIGDQRISVTGKPAEDTDTVVIEGDYSSAAYWIVLSLFVSDDGFLLKGLPPESRQPDSAIVDFLNDLGCRPEFDTEGLRIHPCDMPDPVIEFDVDQRPDLAPPLSVIGLFSKNGILLRGTERLRMKESDRISEICRLAESFGGSCEIMGNSIHISKKNSLSNPGILSFSDHRMIMSGIIAGIIAGFDLVHENIEMIAKSYPEFINHLRESGITVQNLL